MGTEDQLLRADAHFSVGNHSFKSRPHDFMDHLRHLQAKAFTCGGGHDGCGNDVLRGLLEGTRELQDFIRAFARRCLNGDEARATHGQGAGLVKKNRMCSSQSFESGASFN